MQLEWNIERVRDLIQAPQRILNEEPWGTWLRMRGGTSGAYHYIRTLPLQPDQQRLLQFWLGDTYDSPQVLARSLNIHLATLYRQQRRLLERLATMLNESVRERPAETGLWQPPAPSLLPPPTSLLGRTHDQEAVGKLLAAPEVRCVTLTGPGGVGKTRLALALADAAKPLFADGVVLVALAPLIDPLLVVPAIAQALGIETQPGAPILPQVQQVLRQLRLLLVLDNAEHLLEAAPMLVSLLATAPGLKVLVTSRMRLRLPGEHEYPVASLALPDPNCQVDPSALATYSAVQLFVERTRTMVPQFELTPETGPTVVALCRRLHGLPLAIELAAARSKICSPAMLLAQLEHSIDLLDLRDDHLPRRQRSLRGTLAWSYGLLTPVQQRVFRALGVFAGPWTLSAARAVTALDELSLLDTLSILVDLHFVVQHPTQAPGPELEPVFGMLDMIRVFAQEELRQHGEESMAQHLHALAFVELAERLAPELLAVRDPGWLDRLDSDLHHFRAAFRWAIATCGQEALAVRLFAALWRFLVNRGYVGEAIEWVQLSITHAHRMPAEQQAPWLLGAGMVLLIADDVAGADPILHECLAMYQGLGDRWGEGFALNYLQMLYGDQDDLPRSYATLKQSCAIRQEIGDKVGVAACLNNLANHAITPNQDRVALYTEALALFREVEDLDGVALVLGNMAHSLRDQGKHVQARLMFEESLRHRRRLGDKRRITSVLRHLAEFERREHRLERMTALLAETLEIQQHVGEWLRFLGGLEYIAFALGTNGDAAFGVWMMACVQSLRQGAPAAPFDTTEAVGDDFDRWIDGPPVVEWLAFAKAQLGPNDWETAWYQGSLVALPVLVREAIARLRFFAGCDGVARLSDPALPPFPLL